jgi:hypothetical protein
MLTAFAHPEPNLPSAMSEIIPDLCFGQNAI